MLARDSIRPPSSSPSRPRRDGGLQLQTSPSRRAVPPSAAPCPLESPSLGTPSSRSAALTRPPTQIVLLLLLVLVLLLPPDYAAPSVHGPPSSAPHRVPPRATFDFRLSDFGPAHRVSSTVHRPPSTRHVELDRGPPGREPCTRYPTTNIKYRPLRSDLFDPRRPLRPSPVVSP